MTVLTVLEVLSVIIVILAVLRVLIFLTFQRRVETNLKRELLVLAVLLVLACFSGFSVNSVFSVPNPFLFGRLFLRISQAAKMSLSSLFFEIYSSRIYSI